MWLMAIKKMLLFQRLELVGSLAGARVDASCRQKLTAVVKSGWFGRLADSACGATQRAKIHI
jgi:hypothetical protein